MSDVLRVGLAGLGTAGTLVLPWIKLPSGGELAAVADPRPEALQPFDAKGVKTFRNVEEMCASDAVDVIWIATPNSTHMKYAILAAENGKHVVCEKPMALNIDQAEAMVEAVERNQVKYVQRSKNFDPPIQKMREIVESGDLGRLIHINTWNYRGWLVNYGFTAEDLDPERGGGLTYRQGPHQLDIVRYLGGGMVKSVRGSTGRWSADFDTEGNYSAFLQFQDGTPALLSNNGYGYFDIAELTWGIGEAGPGVPVESLYEPRPRQDRMVEPNEKYAGSTRRLQRAYEAEPQTAGDDQPFMGLTILSCERGDIRQTPNGLYIYTAEGRKEVSCDAWGSRAYELPELSAAVAEDRPPSSDARWGMATLEVVLAIRESSAKGREVELKHQVPIRR